jgi:hypothetical protein
MAKKHKKKKDDESYQLDKKTLGIAVIVILVIAILVGLYYSGVLGFAESDKKDTAKVVEKEEAEIPEFELIAIAPDCEKCISADEAVKIIKDAPTLKITSDKIVEHDSDEGKTLIAKYELTKLPAFILKGDNLDIDLPVFTKKEDALVFDKTPAPYFDVATGTVKGLVDITKIVDPDCEQCFDMDKLVENLKLMAGMAFDSEKTVPFDSAEGKELVEKYSITKVPTIIFSEDAKDYEQITSIWDTVGSTETDGSMILRTVQPPYRDLETDSIKGIVTVTSLVDETCEECFDTKMLTDLFKQQIGMVFGEEKTIDISTAEGKQLLTTFEITYVPTVILSKDAGVYPNIDTVWSQIGTVTDGQYALTKLNLAEGVVYKDLSTGEIVGLPEEDTEESEDSEE